MFAGIDGCKKGWLASIFIDNTISFQWFSCIHQFVSAYPTVEYIGIDMVIGLPDQARKGGRPSDIQARKLLGKRGSSVFSAPCRAAVYSDSYKEALQKSRESSPDNIGLSKQTYNIFPSIQNIDQLLRNTPTLQPKFFEVHPELSFWQMNKKKELASKHSKQGFAKRLELLKQENLIESTVSQLSKDHLDATACLWSIMRIANGVGNRVPTQATKDAVGLPMNINW